MLCSTRNRAYNLASKNALGSGACHSSSSFQVASMPASSSAHPAHSVAYMLAGLVRQRPGLEDPVRQMLFHLGASHSLPQFPAKRNPSGFRAMSGVSPEQQRFGSRFAQFEHFANLFVIHLLVFMHQHCVSLAFGQRHHVSCESRSFVLSRTSSCSTLRVLSATSGVVPVSASGWSR